MHALAVGDHFAVLIRGQLAANFRKGEKSREEITDLMAGGEDMAELEAQITAEGEELHSPAHVRASQESVPRAGR
jgi:simple sugar transport system ATP-binding protein